MNNCELKIGDRVNVRMGRRQVYKGLFCGYEGGKAVVRVPQIKENGELGFQLVKTPKCLVEFVQPAPA